MFSKFNYNIGSLYNREINPHHEVGNSLYEKSIKDARKCLEEFIYTKGHIDGSSLQSHWFKAIDANIFISHSHEDINKVKSLAGWLYNNFGLKSFIDSCVWGYCNDLLKQIDDKYCLNSDKKTYNYNLRNYTTSHVHVMLSLALTEMIDKTECIMFINTPNSISLENEISDHKYNNATHSPWIYHELAMTTMVRQTEPVRTKQIIEHRAFNKIPTFDYNVDKYLKEMVNLNDEDLIQWKKNFSSDTHPLDELYLIKKLINRK